jgi:hypothetical protein
MGGFSFIFTKVFHVVEYLKNALDTKQHPESYKRYACKSMCSIRQLKEMQAAAAANSTD